MWLQEQAKERIRQICRAAQLYAPWLLPEYAAVKNDPAIYVQGNHVTGRLEQMPAFIDRLAIQLGAVLDSNSPAEPNKLYSRIT